MDTAAAALGVERSFSGRRWRFRPTGGREYALSTALEVPDLIARALAARGVSVEAAADFLNPTLRNLLPDPSHLRDMERAAERLADLVEAGATLGILGDYDVDGATSAALLMRFFGSLGVPVKVHVPDRAREGYGPNLPALEGLKAKGASVIATVDCGTAAFEVLDGAQARGLEVIVVDHHLAEARLPAAFAVINPNRLDETSPHRQLAAVGVAYLLVVAVNRALRARGFYRTRPEPDLRRWLDLVALGTVADVVPLVGVNRALVRQGLAVMAGRGNPGLAALGDVARLKARPGAYHLGFVFGPRINAGGRVGEAALGVRLLTTDDSDEAAALAIRLDALNQARQEIEAAVLAAAVEQVETRGLGNAPLVVAAGEGWHAGVIGIIASRLKERYGRPAVALAIEGEEARGSCRSIPGIDIGGAITAARQAGLLARGGGHAMAAGFTVAADGIASLAAFLMERCAPGAAAAMAEAAGVALDGALALEGATASLVQSVELLAPFGTGNSEPRFALTGVRLVRTDIVGSGHLRCVLSSAGGGRLKGIAFGAVGEPLGAALLGAAGQGPLHLAGRLRLNRWQERDDVELHIDDAAHATAS
jgi:single-stranded-DNA-specific exonuclease